MNADQLRQAMAALPEPTTEAKPPYWDHWRLDLWRRVTGGQDPRWLFDWPCLYHTMRVNHWSSVVASEYWALEPDIENYWYQAIAMPHFGNPPDYFADTDFSMNQIHQCYHLKQWQDFTGWKVAGLERIVEFGGGYGAMALACHRLGFRGEYIIYDLPEFGLLQQYYLSQTGVPVTHWDKPEPVEADLLIGIYSLSECPFELRDEFIGKINEDSFLFLYSGQWEEYNNVEYFQALKPSEGYSCRHTELTHLPDRNNWYSVGVWR